MWECGSTARRKGKASGEKQGLCLLEILQALLELPHDPGPNAAVSGSTWPILLDICKTMPSSPA